VRHQAGWTRRPTRRSLKRAEQNAHRS